MVCPKMDERAWKIIEKPILGFEGYTVTNAGGISSTKRGGKKPLKFKEDKDGYYNCTLYRDGKPYHFRVNRLVADAFVTNPDNLPIVNHIDGDKKNNFDWNLEWTTYKGNNDHATTTGLHNLNIPIVQMDMQGNVLGSYYSTREAEKVTGIDGSCISKVCKGKRKSAGGFLWSYKEE
jgi:hypothetical protein